MCYNGCPYERKTGPYGSTCANGNRCPDVEEQEEEVTEE